MADADNVELPPNWEAVDDGQGRTYYWNVETDETSWVVPTVLTSKSSVAAAYVNQASSGSAGSGGGGSAAVEHELAALRGSSVASLTKQFADSASVEPSSSSSGMTTPPKTIDVASELSSKSKAVNVSAMKKYREAKAAEEAAASGGSGGGKPGPPPKVNLYE